MQHKHDKEMTHILSKIKSSNQESIVIKNILKKALPYQDNPFENREITYKDVERGYKIAAQVVSKHGDKYLPVFIRMHKELENFKKQVDFHELAKNVANDNKEK